MLHPVGDITTVFVVPVNVTLTIRGMPRISGGDDGIKIHEKKKKAKIPVQHIGQPIENADPSKMRVP